jgi:hypothetical protein
VGRRAGGARDDGGRAYVRARTIAADGYSAAFSAGAAIYLATAVAGALALPARLGDASPRMASA